MAHAVTGKAGAVTFAGGAITGKLTEWMFELTGSNVVDRGAGEDWQSKVPTFSDWKATFKALATDTTEMSITGTSSDVSLVNTSVAIALKRKSADTSAWFSGTGLVTSFRRTHNIEQPSEVEVTVECSEGVAPTMDTTPA
jgi:hypothetical protein